ncbi:Gfo/Idh/MocA family oxidoreductase [Streptomonospora sediminis]
MTEPTRIAVLGLGFMGRRYAAIAADLAGARLTAVCDADEGLATGTAEQYGATAFTDHRRMLDSGAADAVIVALPESAQTDPAIAVAAAGLDLLLEKPVASTPADAERLAAGLDGTAGTHAAAHLLRADPRYQAAAAAAAQPDFGPVVHITGVRRSRQQTARRVAGRTSLLYYLGVHDFDAVAWLAGSPVRTVHAIANRPGGWEWDVDATTLVSLTCGNGAVASLELTWVVADTSPRGLETRMFVAGTGGSLEIGGGDEVMVATAAGQQAHDALHWPAAGGRVVGSLRNQVEQWVAAARGRGSAAATIEQGLAAARVAFAVEESLRTGHPAEVAQ